MNQPTSIPTVRKYAFTLVEVVLALGIFLVTVLALVGLLGPTLKSVSDVENTDEVISVVNTLNAFLQNSPEIAQANESKFETIYNAVRNGGYATVFVFKAYPDQTSDVIGIEIAFDAETNASLQNQNVDFSLAAGQIYRVVLSASSVIPAPSADPLRSNSRNDDGIYTLTKGYDDYPEGYFAMEARIFAREQDMQAVGGGTITGNFVTLQQLSLEEPIFTYNTAIVR